MSNKVMSDRDKEIYHISSKICEMDEEICSMIENVAELVEVRKTNLQYLKQLQSCESIIKFGKKEETN